MVPEASSASIDGDAFRCCWFSSSCYCVELLFLHFLRHVVVWSRCSSFFRPFLCVADFVDDIGSDPSTFSSTMALLTVLLLVWSLFRQQIRQQRFKHHKVYRIFAKHISNVTDFAKTPPHAGAKISPLSRVDINLFPKMEAAVDNDGIKVVDGNCGRFDRDVGDVGCAVKE